MKRTLIITMALGMVLALATPAVAKKGGGGPSKPASIGYTCQDLLDNGATGWTDYDFNETTGAYSVDLTPKAAVCMDIPAPSGTWTIDVSTAGNAKGLYMEVADSRPGDVCWSYEFGRRDTPEGAFHPSLQASSTDVCGARWTDTSPYGHDTDPYVFYAATTNKPQSGTITITVTPPAP